MRHRLQMVGPHAGAIAAEMVKFHPLGDGPHDHLVGEAMSPTVFKTPVPVRAASSLPLPAIIANGHLFEEALFSAPKTAYGPHYKP